MSNSIEGTGLAARFTARRAIGAIQQNLHVSLQRSNSSGQPRICAREPLVLLLRLRTEALVLLLGLRTEALVLLLGLRTEALVLLLGLRTEALVLLFRLRTVALSLLLTCPEVILKALDFPPPRPEHGENDQTDDQETERSTQGLP